MLDYSLAKELKEAGFPQTGRGKYIPDESNPPSGRVIPNGTYGTGSFVEPECWVKVPTLSELIEACGDNFDTLTQTGEASWEAGIADPCPDGGPVVHHGITFGEGATREEAVGRLWLALNKKP